MNMLEAALNYAANGWKIFPCHWPIFKDDKIFCSCGKPPGKGKGFCSSPGKHPKTSHGFYDASRDEKVIRAWWQQSPRANIGAATGVDNNLLVLDVDPPHGGDKTLAELLAKNGDFPDTLKAVTGSGGEHIVFQHVEGLSNCVGAIGSGLDIRTQGGYIVVAPSLHPSGKRYEWVSTDTALAPAPDWLIKEIQKRSGVAPGTPDAPTDGQFDYWMRIAQGVREGERHVMILKLAGLLIGARRLPATLSLSLLRAYNQSYCKPPLPESEVDERFSRIIKRQKFTEAKRNER